jgi:hypothetical protein
MHGIRAGDGILGCCNVLGSDIDAAGDPEAVGVVTGCKLVMVCRAALRQLAICMWWLHVGS